MFLRFLIITAILAGVFAACEQVEAQQQVQPPAQQQWLAVRTPWYPGKAISRAWMGAWYGVAPRVWAVPVAPSQPCPHCQRY